jgi:DNA polymerase elongation subunit (family B)
MPFILLSKKRYVGTLYENEPNNGKLKFMGLSIKRRESCDYLKDTYGTLLNILLKEKENTIEKSMDFLNTALQKLITGDVSKDKLAISKSLSSYYKFPDRIAHNVLAERIALRDPGNKPKPGERMKYLFIIPSTTTAVKGGLLGDRIETIEYITEKNLKVDYKYYITNQLMKPIIQLFGLALEKIWEIQGKKQMIRNFNEEIKRLEYNCKAKTGGENGKDYLETFMKEREKTTGKYIYQLLFHPFLNELDNRNNRIRTIDNIFAKQVKRG